MATAKLRVIVTGTTGMVGEGVMHECLLHPSVEAVLVINRRPGGVTHPKLTEIIHTDFYDLSPIADQLQGYNACFFCLGTTSLGKDKDEYYKITYTLTMHMAQTLVSRNPGMTFTYVSGRGTDSTERGKVHWARVKGKTENDLMKLPFKKVFAFRPGFMKPTPGLKNTLKFYKYINWLYPIGRALSPKNFCELREVGLAMIHCVDLPVDRKVIDSLEIIRLAKEA